MRIWIGLLCVTACLPDSLPGDGDGDGYTFAIDCDDADPNVGPANAGGECDGTDTDGDGFSEADGDCDDNDPNLSPTASDIAGDDIDQNCDGMDGTDIDGDGFASTASGGEDCDDATPTIHPGATEIGWNDIDEDCSGKDLHDYVQISAGSYHVCGVTSTGTLACWGNPEIDAPEQDSSESYTSVACGINRTCIVTQDNTLDCYGDFIDTHTDVPGTSQGEFLSVALPVMSDYPICGITQEYALACGHCPEPGDPACTPPSGTFKEVDIASERGCALSEAGEVFCWGSEDSTDPLQSSVPSGTDYHNIQLSSLADACALTEEGQLVCWGASWSDLGPAKQAESDSRGPFTQMSAYSGALCAIEEEDQSLWCYGIHEGSVPTGTFTQVSIGYHFGCALDTLGEAHCWELYLENSVVHEGVLDPP